MKKSRKIFRRSPPLQYSYFRRTVQKSQHNKNKTEVMMILTPHITEAGASPAIYDTQSLENEFKDFDDNKFLKDIKNPSVLRLKLKSKPSRKNWQRK